MDNHRMQICPLCGGPLAGTEPVVACDYCGALCHAACWQAHGGCPTPNCPRAPAPQPEALQTDASAACSYPADPCHCACVNCGALLTHDQHFCPYCGAPQPAPDTPEHCPGCGAHIPAGSAFCPFCGVRMEVYSQQPAAPAQTAAVPPFVPPEQYADQQRRTKKRKKLVLWITLSVLLLALLGAGGFFGWKYYEKNYSPRLIGMTEEAARDRLSALSRGSQVEYAYTDDTDAGYVFDQDPSPSARMEEGQSVKLYVSKGKWSVVPALEGKTEAEAKSLLTEAFLSPDISYAFDDDVPEGSVVSQGDPAGEKKEPGSRVALTVSKGSGVKIPALAGKSEEEAVAALEALGLVVDIERDYSSTVPEGSVIECTAGPVDPGAAVTLVISRGADNRVSIADFSGEKERDAVASIEAAGLPVRVEYVYEACESDPDAETVGGTVLSQNHTGLCEPGTEIVLRVSRPSVIISGVDFSLNPSGGLDTDIIFKNISDREIQTILFSTYYYDAQGDPAPDESSASNHKNLKYNGPVAAEESVTGHWNAVLYHPAVSCVYVREITVTFADGSTQTMEHTWFWYSDDYYGGPPND